MNTNVWIITKICKALNLSFRVISCGHVLFLLWSAVLRPPSPFLTKARKERGLFASSSYVQTSSSKFLKVLLQSPGASVSLGLPVTFSFHVFGICTFPTDHKAKIAFRSPLTADLPPTFTLILPSLGAASTEGPGRARPFGGPSPYRRLEVMSKQVIIMRCALQKLTRFSRRSVTHSRASRYSRESSSKTCSRSTAREEEASQDRSCYFTQLPPAPGPAPWAAGLILPALGAWWGEDLGVLFLPGPRPVGQWMGILIACF